MGLRLKFNLVLLLVFVLGLGVSGYVSHQLLQKNAREEVLRTAGVMMEAAMAMRSYTVAQVRPHLRVVENAARSWARRPSGTLTDHTTPDELMSRISVTSGNP